MTESYKPFFSRKYITGLMWFSLLAILILSSMGPDDIEFLEVEHNETKTIYWSEIEQRPNSITLLFTTPLALNQTERQLQQLKSTILKQRLGLHLPVNTAYEVLPQQDHIAVRMHWNQDQQVPDLNSLLVKLKTDIDVDNLQQQISRLKARAYLENKAPEDKLLNRFMQQLQTEQTDTIETRLHENYQAMFSHYKLVISGQDAESLSEQFASVVPSYTQINTQLSPPLSQRFNEPATDSRFYLLLGSAIPARTDPTFINHRLAANLLQHNLQLNADQTRFQFRLSQNSLINGGYRAIILSSTRHPSAILNQLSSTINEDQAEQLQQQFSYQWQERMRDTEQQLRVIEQIALYGLHKDTLKGYAEQLLQADSEKTVAIALNALKSEPQISILLPPLN